MGGDGQCKTLTTVGAAVSGGAISGNLRPLCGTLAARLPRAAGQAPPSERYAIPHNPASTHAARADSPDWLPLALAILLGTAAIVAGLIAWRAAVHAGHAQQEFAISTQAVNNANVLQQNASAVAFGERNLFLSFRSAMAQNDQARSAEIRGLMDAETVRAVDWWLAKSPAARPTSPFSSSNPDWTTPRRIINARAALDESVVSLHSAEGQLRRSHNLEFLEAALALAFLTGGLTSTLGSAAAQRVLLTVSAALLTLAFVGLVVLW